MTNTGFRRHRQIVSIVELRDWVWSILIFRNSSMCWIKFKISDMCLAFHVVETLRLISNKSNKRRCVQVLQTFISLSSPVTANINRWASQRLTNSLAVPIPRNPAPLKVEKTHVTVFAKWQTCHSRWAFSAENNKCVIVCVKCPVGGVPCFQLPML